MDTRTLTCSGTDRIATWTGGGWHVPWISRALDEGQAATAVTLAELVDTLTTDGRLYGDGHPDWRGVHIMALELGLTGDDATIRVLEHTDSAEDARWEEWRASGPKEGQVYEWPAGERWFVVRVELDDNLHTLALVDAHGNQREARQVCDTARLERIA